MNYNQLPEYYTPGDRDVVIGKGKKYFFHKGESVVGVSTCSYRCLYDIETNFPMHGSVPQGNAMLRDLVASMLDEYALAKTKLEKSLIISDAAERVRQNGNFVKRDTRTNKWVLAEDLLCREKISAVFRDALHQRGRIGSGPGRVGCSSFTKQAIHHVVEQEKKRRTSAPPALFPVLPASQTKPPLDWSFDEVASQAFGLGPENNYLEKKRRSSAPPALLPVLPASQTTAPLDWSFDEVASQAFGLGPEKSSRQAPLALQMPPQPQANPPKLDFFVIFSSALLANVNEDSDPFEPKPLFEGSRTA
jgi:hypothetical protein